jgi:hypothetical protein
MSLTRWSLELSASLVALVMRCVKNVITFSTRRSSMRATLINGYRRLRSAQLLQRSQCPAPAPTSCSPRRGTYWKSRLLRLDSMAGQGQLHTRGGSTPATPVAHCSRCDLLRTSGEHRAPQLALGRLGPSAWCPVSVAFRGSSNACAKPNQSNCWTIGWRLKAWRAYRGVVRERGGMKARSLPELVATPGVACACLAT